MMVAPVDADKNKTKHIAQEYRDERAKRGQVSSVRHLQFQHHDGDDDGEHTIAERFQSPPAHSHSPFNVLTPHNGLSGHFSWIHAYRRQIVLLNRSARGLDGRFS
jgi:hypothetical protein